MVLTATILVAGATYLAGQYRSATLPASLDDLPQYPYAGSAFPVSTLTPEQRVETESGVRALADRLAPEYRVESERLLACTGPFIWDALRSNLTGYLSSFGFHIQASGQRPDDDGDPAYIIWARTSRLLKLVNSNRIMAIGVQQPIQAGQPTTPVHLYAYLELAATTT